MVQALAKPTPLAGRESPVLLPDRLKVALVHTHPRNQSVILPLMNGCRRFNQQELQVFLGGKKTPIDINDLRQNTNYVLVIMEVPTSDDSSWSEKGSVHESESANTILTPFRQLAAHKPPRPLFPPVAKTGHRPSSPCSLTVPINVKQSLLHMQCCRLHFDANIFGVVSDKPEYCHTFCSCQGRPPSGSFTTHAEPLGGATRVLKMSLSRWRGMSAGGMF